MKKLLALTAVVGVAAAVAIPAFAATRTVKIGDDWFVSSSHASTQASPATVTIRKGSSVKWVWGGHHQHQVFQIGGPGHFHSPVHKGSGTFTHRFTKPGTYKFVCPFQSMYINVRVK